MAFTIPKKEHLIGGALVVAALAYLWYLHNKTGQDSDIALTRPQDLGKQIPAAQASAPGYPNAGVNQLGDINIGGSPLYLNYNIAPNVPTPISIQPPPLLGNPKSSTGGCGCSDSMGSECSQSSWLTTSIQIPAASLVDAVTNMQSVFRKGQTPGGLT